MGESEGVLDITLKAETDGEIDCGTNHLRFRSPPVESCLQEPVVSRGFGAKGEAVNKTLETVKHMDSDMAAHLVDVLEFVYDLADDRLRGLVAAGLGAGVGSLQPGPRKPDRTRKG